MDSDSSIQNNIVKLPPRRQSLKSSEEKWGKKVMALGFCIVPSLLFRAQSRLGLNPTQLAIILQLCEYWWESERIPYPSKKAMSERLGISPRQVQRHLAELEKANLISRKERRGGHGGKLSNRYDLKGLVLKLKELEPEFRLADKSAKTRRRDVSKRGHKLRQAIATESQEN